MFHGMSQMLIVSHSDLSMAASSITQKMKRHILVVVLVANLNDKETAVNFLKLANSFIFQVRNKQESTEKDVTSVTKGKKPNIVRTTEFFQQVEIIINHSPSSKSMWATVKQLKMANSTVRHFEALCFPVGLCCLPYCPNILRLTSQNFLQ